MVSANSGETTTLFYKLSAPLAIPASTSHQLVSMPVTPPSYHTRALLSRFVICVPILSAVSLEEQKCLILMKSSLLIFFFQG